MSGVGAKGDHCTTTTLWSIVHPHLLYYARSPVPLEKYNILHKILIIVAWFYRNIYDT
jgi:hypothetical protein